MSRASQPPFGVPSASPGDALGMTLAGRYRIVEPLAEGGMGTIFVGVDEQTGNDVAIKVMRGELAQSEEALARFRREVRAVATLDSPYIVSAHDAGTVDGMPYLVMERLQGQGLDEAAAKGEVSAYRAITIVIDLLEGLSHAHAAGIIHRDLKPSNVWLTDDGRVKILDFGVAKMQGSARAAGDETGKLTGSGAVLGSPAYMSPEQLVSSKEADERADLWSVGVLLYELLTGKMLFDAETVGGIFANVIRMRVPPLREVIPGASPELERIVAQCLDRDPEQRHAAARALADELRALLDAETPLIRRDSIGPDGRAIPVPRASHNTLSEAPTVALPDGAMFDARPDRTGASRSWLAGGLLLAVIGVGVVALMLTRNTTPASAPSAQTTAVPDAPTRTNRDAPNENAEVDANSATTSTTTSIHDGPAPSASGIVASPRYNPPVAPPRTGAAKPSASAAVAPADELWENSRH